MSDLSAIPTSDLMAEIQRRRDAAENLLNETAMVEIIANPSLLASDEKLREDAASVINMAAKLWNISPRAIISGRRTSTIAEARMACMTALRCIGYRHASLGEAFDRDHGCIINAFKKTTLRMKTNRLLSSRVNTLIRVIQSNANPTPTHETKEK